MAVTKRMGMPNNLSIRWIVFHQKNLIAHEDLDATRLYLKTVWCPIDNLP
jgi:hypothetical protein